jgi:hypothetical protein
MKRRAMYAGPCASIPPPPQPPPPPPQLATATLNTAGSAATITAGNTVGTIAGNTLEGGGVGGGKVGLPQPPLSSHSCFTNRVHTNMVT